MGDLTNNLLTERGPSPLASNNPFRSRVADNATSPALAPIRSVSTNPFLDVTEIKSREGTTRTTAVADSAQQPSVDKTTDIFVSGVLFF